MLSVCHVMSGSGRFNTIETSFDPRIGGGGGLNTSSPAQLAAPTLSSLPLWTHHARLPPPWCRGRLLTPTRHYCLPPPANPSICSSQAIKMMHSTDTLCSKVVAPPPSTGWPCACSPALTSPRERTRWGESLCVSRTLFSSSSFFFVPFPPLLKRSTTYFKTTVNNCSVSLPRGGQGGAAEGLALCKPHDGRAGCLRS